LSDTDARPDLVIQNGTVLPMTESGEYFPGHLAVRNGRISAVISGPCDTVDASRTLDADGAAVLPGIIQGHVHVVQSLLRHQADGLELLDWLRLRTWPYEAALDGDAVEAAAELGIVELLSGGTTAALDFGTTHDHDRVFKAAEGMGIRLVSGKTHMDIGDDAPAALREDTERSLADAAALGHRWHGAADGRLRYAVAPRFALSCSPDLLRGCAQLARENGWLLQSHASENLDEVAQVRTSSGRGNIDFLGDHGLLGDDVILAHGVHLDDGEIQRLAATGTTICHCPGANVKLGSGIADVPRLLKSGVRVMLGADGPPCNNRLSAFHEMSLAATIHNLKYGPAALDPWQVLAMVTRDAARALHLESEIGTLEHGKAADIVVVELGEWSALPGGDPASRIVFGGGPHMIRHVVVAGRPIVVDGELVDVDTGGLRSRIDDAWKGTLRRMEELP
jgi:cytosine/adenosine deaminase-related metal-dependent hydrolase